MIEATRCLGVVDLSSEYYQQREMTLLDFSARSQAAQKIIRGHKMKHGDYLVLLNKYNTRIRLFVCNHGLACLVIYEYDREGQNTCLLKALHGLEVVKLKKEDAEIIKLRIERGEETKERRQAMRKRKLRAA